MPKKSQERASQYARAATNRRRERKPRPSRYEFPEATVTEQSAAPAVPDAGRRSTFRTRNTLVDYRYLVGDLRNIAIVSLIIVAVFIALVLLLPR